MKIHSFPWRTLLVRSIAFALLGSFAAHGQAQRHSVEEAEKQIDRSERAEDKLDELFGTTQLTGEDLDPEFFDIMKRFTYGEVFSQGSLDRRQRELIALVVLTTSQCLAEVRVHVAGSSEYRSHPH
jgi:alkylhydroperoxidase/carboxymuconolactone decarboxylase family protein YurZ